MKLVGLVRLIGPGTNRLDFTTETKHFKFGTEVDHGKYHTTDNELLPHGGMVIGQSQVN